MTHKARWILAATMLLAACSGGTTEVKIVSPIEALLRPSQHGYAFANFPSSATPEEFDAKDLVSMFGAEACVDGNVDNCKPIAEAAAWARMVNQARISGHCEGMVVEATKRFVNNERPPTIELSKDGETVSEIIRAFSTQFLPEVVDERDAWAKKNLPEVINEVARELEAGNTSLTLGLYTENGGHAVLPYALSTRESGVIRMNVYDSNWPGKERFVDFDLASNEWTFSFSGSDPENDAKAWTGGAGDIDLNSLATREQSTCPFCKTATKVKNSLLVLRSTDNAWTLQNENGTYSPALNNAVEGIVSRPIRSAANYGTGIFEYVVSVEGTALTFKPRGVASAFIVGETAITQVETLGQNDTEIVIAGDVISATDAGATLTVASNNFVAQVTGNNTVIEVNETNLQLSTESASGQVLNLTVNEEVSQIRVVAVGANAGSGGGEFQVVTSADGQLDLNKVSAVIPAELAYVEPVESFATPTTTTTTTTLTVPPSTTTTTSTVPPTTTTSSTSSTTTTTTTTTSTVPPTTTSTVPPTTTTSSTTTTTTSTVPPTTTTSSTTTTTTSTVPPTTTTSSTTTTTTTTTSTVPPTTTTSSTTTTTAPVQSQTISIDAGSYVSSYRMTATPPTVTSTALGSGAKTYASASPSVCSIGSSTGAVTFVAAGTCRLNVNIAADASYAFATSAQISFSLVYQIGDTGPGGGKIFMTPSAGANTTNSYFESALSGWNGAGTDTLVTWCSFSNQYVGSAGVAPQLTSIGSGRANTNAMVAAGKCTSGAASTARSYAGGGLSDWYLPSLGELQQMYAQRATIGGFNLMTEVGTSRTTTTYWSSSEDGSQNFYARSWSFLTNGNDNWSKSLKFGVRPIRSFEPIS